MSQLFSSGGQSIGASAQASVLPMNIQGLFPLGLTGLIPYDYTVEVRNRFKGLDLIDRVPDELWNVIRDIVQVMNSSHTQTWHLQVSH